MLKKETFQIKRDLKETPKVVKVSLETRVSLKETQLVAVEKEKEKEKVGLHLSASVCLVVGSCSSHLTAAARTSDSLMLMGKLD